MCVSQHGQAHWATWSEQGKGEGRGGLGRFPIHPENITMIPISQLAKRSSRLSWDSSCDHLCVRRSCLLQLKERSFSSPLLLVLTKKTEARREENGKVLTQILWLCGQRLSRNMAEASLADTNRLKTFPTALTNTPRATENQANARISSPYVMNRSAEQYCLSYPWTPNTI